MPHANSQTTRLLKKERVVHTLGYGALIFNTNNLNPSNYRFRGLDIIAVKNAPYPRVHS